jgi:chromatin remodeling complex protein RSC6
MKTKFYKAGRWARSRKHRKIRRRKRKERKRRRCEVANPGFANLFDRLKVSPALQAIVKVETTSRCTAVRLTWNYIKANHLQNPNDGRLIIPDATLARVMGTEGQEMNAFTMLRYIDRHLQKNSDDN